MTPRYEKWVHPSQLCIALDAGLSGTGYCVMQDGRPIETGTIRPPRDGSLDERLLSLKEKLDAVFNRLYDSVDIPADDAPPIAVVAIESYQGHTHKNNMLSMMKNCQARGVCLTVAASWAAEVTSINKKTAPKSDADWLAKSANVEGSEHARDAYHLGVIAGFDRPPKAGRN